MKKLLIVVDMQNDFINGSLGTSEAEAIVPAVQKKIKRCQAENAAIVLTMDTHADDYLDTLEGRNLPVRHCIKDTPGWKLHSGIASLISGYPHTIYEKITFGSSAFAADLSCGKYQDYTDIELVGLCTDICVISNALLVKTFLLEAHILVDASCCAGVTPESHENALNAMKMCQIEII